MDLLKYRIPLFQAPEVTGTEPAPAVDPAIAAAEPTADPQPEPKPAAKASLPSAVIDEITSLRARNRETAAELAAAKQRATDAEALAARLQQGQNGTAAEPAKPAPQPQSRDDAEVSRRAEYMLFERDVRSMQGDGIKEFGARFNDDVRVLDALGATDDAFIGQVMAVDRSKAHQMLHLLAEDSEKTVALLRMAPAQRIAELTRMSMALAEPKTETAADPKPADPKPAEPKAAPPAGGKTSVSKAPPPAPSVQTSAAKVKDWRSDDASDEEFSRGYDEHMKTRRVRH